MNRCFLALALAALPCSLFATDVGVSVTVGEPGFYGHIDIGNVPHPQVINPHPTPGSGQPVYMRVPPGHAKHWSKHCAEYNACGQRVYFVNEDWYNNVYVPHHQAQQQAGSGGGRHEGGDARDGKGTGHGRGHNKDRGKGHGNDD